MDLQGSNSEDLRRLRLLRQSQGPLRVSVAPERRLLDASGTTFIRRSPDMRTAKPTQPKPVTPINTEPFLRKIATETGLGGLRSGVGTVQSISGLYDLITPGKGNNRLSNWGDRYAKDIDATVKDGGYNSGIYKTAQGGTDILQLLAGAGVVKAVTRGATYLPKTTKIITALNKLGKSGKTGKAVSNTAKFALRNDTVANVGVDLATGIGQKASKGERVTPFDVAVNTLPGATLEGAGLLYNNRKVIKQLTKETNPDNILNILKNSKNLDNTDSEIAKLLANTKNKDDVKAILKGAYTPEVRTPRSPDGPVPVDKETNVKMGDLLKQSESTPVEKGAKRLFQLGDSQGNYTEWAFTDIDGLARYANNRPGEQVRFVDVPENAIIPTRNGQNVVKVDERVINPTSPQALEQAVEALPPNTAISQQTPVTAAPDGVPSASADIAQADVGNLADEAAQQAEGMKNLYGKETLTQKIAKLWDPLSPLRKMDKARAKALGIRPVDLPKTQSTEALAQVSKNSKEMAAQALKDTNTARVIQKYQTKGADSTDFNFYRVAMRDLEQRADGRPAIFRELDDNSLNNWIAEYEARNPEARQDLLDVVADVRAFQDYGAELVNPEDLARVRLKKDGTEFQFWTPIQRATPDDVATPVISGQNIGTVGRQKILQEQLGSDLPADVSFDALTDYVETVYKQVNQAKVARTVTENVQAGLVPGARVIQTGDETAQITKLRQNLSELRDITKSLKTEKTKVQFKTGEAARAAKASQKEVSNRVRQILRNTVEDTDSQAAIASMSDKDLTDLMRIFNEPDIKKSPNVQQIYSRFVKKSEAHQQLADRLDDIKMDIESLDNARKGIGRELVELRPDSITGRQTILGIDENGNKFRVELPPEYAAVLQGTDKESMNTLLRGLRVAQQPWREAYTGVLNPPFQIAQATFNAIMAPILKGPKVFGPRAMKAAVEAFNGHSLSQQALREGGITIYGGNLQKLVKDTTADALASQADALSRAKWFANPKRAWEQLSLAGGKLDQAARAAIAQVEYDNSIARNLSHEEALANAVYSYNNSLPNFGNAASLITQVDAVIPYFAAGQTGTRQITRALKENPIGVGGRMATLGLALSGITAYNLAKDEGEAFYADMENSGKKYVLDNNVIFVLPGARKDPKTGEWTGIVKIPLPPELRPLGGAVRATFSPTSSGVPVKQYAASVFNFVTGGTASNRSPAIQTGYGLVTGKDPQTGRDIYDETMTDEERRAAAAKYAIGSFGLPGKVVTKGIGEVPNAFVDRVYGAKGISEGGQYYKNEADAIKEVGLNENELREYRSVIAPRSKDLAGNNIKDKTYYDSSKKAASWLSNPKLFEVSKRMDAKNRAAGKPGDPLFDLPPDQLKIILNLMQNYSPGNFEEKAIQTLNPWIKDFNKKRSEYFDQVIPADKKSDKDPMGITIPKATPQLQSKLDQVSKITDKKQKAQFYADNPDITDYYKKTEDYQRTKRAFLGLPQFDRYPTASKEVQGYMDTYNALPKGNGPLKKDGTPSSPARSAWIKSHPNEWAKMTEQWAKQDIFNTQKEGAEAVYEGIDMEQDTIDKLAGALGTTKQGFYSQYGDVDKETALNLLKLLSPDKDYTIKGPDTKRKITKVRYKIPKSVGKKSKVKLG